MRRVTKRRWRATTIVAALLTPWPTAATKRPPEASWLPIAVTGNRAQLPHDLMLVLGARGLAVQRGKLRAPLEVDGHSTLMKLAVSMYGELVGVEVTDACDAVHKLNLGLRNLEARLENVAALAHHRRGHWDDSAAGFARALALDPNFDVAATNLASAQVKNGRADDAIKTLGPFLSPPNAGTYARLVADPELAPLLDRPEVAATRAAVAGMAKLKMTAGNVTLEGTFVFSRQYRLAAAVHGEESWGSCARESELVLLDAAARVAARVPLVSMTESTTDEARDCPIKTSARAGVAGRVAAAQRLLTDLGFSPGGEPGELSTTETGLPRATFARAKVGLVIAGGVARALRGNREIGKAPTLGEHLEAASFFEASYEGLNAVVFEWSRSGREGCETTDPHGIQMLIVD